MTLLPPTNNSDETARQSHPTATLNPINRQGDEKGPQRSAQMKKRRLPTWVDEQLPEWGERICLPEWDGDHEFNGDDDSEDIGHACDEGYRGGNGWKVRYY